MFKADLISLSEGQSYDNVSIFEDADLENLQYPKIFEDWTATACFSNNNQHIVTHHWKIRIIKLNSNRPVAGKGSIFVDRLVLVGDITYENVKIVHQDQWRGLGIPHFFVKRNGIAGQMAFVCEDGTYITHDTNVSSLIFNDSVQTGVTSGHKSCRTIKSQNITNNISNS